VKLTAAHKAGILYLFPVLVILGAWYILLFVGNCPSVHARDTFLYFLNQPSYRQYFWWLLVLPTLCLLLSVAYFSRLPQARIGAFSLFGMGTLLALAAWFTIAPPFALLVSLPLFYTFGICRQHLTNGSAWMPKSGTR